MLTNIVRSSVIPPCRAEGEGEGHSEGADSGTPGKSPAQKRFFVDRCGSLMLPLEQTQKACHNLACQIGQMLSERNAAKGCASVGNLPPQQLHSCHTPDRLALVGHAYAQQVNRFSSLSKRFGRKANEEDCIGALFQLDCTVCDRAAPEDSALREAGEHCPSNTDILGAGYLWVLLS